MQVSKIVSRGFVVILVLLLSGALLAEGTYFPRASQRSEVIQRIGSTDISIVYHSPAVKGRAVWGQLVKYGQVWRAGANENTVISFTHPVKVNGTDLPAGTYGLHMIPDKYEFTVIFSKNSTSWGSFSYQQAEDQVRVKARPQSGDYQEWLSYTFVDRSENSATVELQWEKIRLPLKIDVDVDNIVMTAVRANPGTTWQELNQAANYCLQKKTHMDEALGWVDKSIALNANFRNHFVKAGLLNASGHLDKAEKVMDNAVQYANQEWMLNQYGYALVNNKKLDKAVKIFKMNVEKYPDSWNVYDSYAEALAMKGDKKSAKKAYKQALAKLPAEDPQGHKSRIENILAEL